MQRRTGIYIEPGTKGATGNSGGQLRPAFKPAPGRGRPKEQAPGMKAGDSRAGLEGSGEVRGVRDNAGRELMTRLWESIRVRFGVGALLQLWNAGEL